MTTVSQLAQAVRSGTRRASEVLEQCLARIERDDPRLSAFVRTNEVAGELAASIDERVARGEDPGPLAGVPIALKDNLALEAAAVTCGSKMLEGYVSPFSATAVERLLAAGAVPVGHANMDEFGMGSSTENSALFVTKNPWDLERVPGGSSGGSAAAVAAGVVPVALGTDTGGSIRQPAALCGVFGLKPTYGRVSRYGLVAFASSLDQIGPITTNAADAAEILKVIAGRDPLDATSCDHPVDDYAADLQHGVAGLRVGMVRQFLSESLGAGLAPAVRENWTDVADSLSNAGAEIVDVDLPSAPAAIATYYVLANSEASANLSRFDGIRYGHRANATNLDDLYQSSRSEGFGAEVKRRILLGTFALSSGYYDAYYGKAVAVAGQLKKELGAALNRCDVLLTPTTPTTAFPLGEKTEDPLSMYLSDVFTTLASLTGLPAVAVPSGLDPQGLPMSLQFIGKAFDERTVLRCAAALEGIAGPIGSPTGFPSTEASR